MSCARVTSRGDGGRGGKGVGKSTKTYLVPMLFHAPFGSVGKGLGIGHQPTFATFIVACLLYFCNFPPAAARVSHGLETLLLRRGPGSVRPALLRCRGGRDGLHQGLVQIAQAARIAQSGGRHRRQTGHARHPRGLAFAGGRRGRFQRRRREHFFRLRIEGHLREQRLLLGGQRLWGRGRRRMLGTAPRGGWRAWPVSIVFIQVDE